MPLILDPKRATFDVWLDSDKSIPAKKRPTFVFRHVTAAKAMELMEVYDRLPEQQSGAAALQLIHQALEGVLAGWRNMGQYKHGEHRLAEILTLDESNELFEKALAGMNPGAGDLGKSESQP